MCLDVYWVPDSYICLPVWKVITPLYKKGRDEPTYYKTLYRDCFCLWRRRTRIDAATTEYTFHTEPFIELRGECVHSYLEKPIVEDNELCVPALAVGVLGYNRTEVGSFQLILDPRQTGPLPKNVDKPPGFDNCLLAIQQRHRKLQRKYPEKYNKDNKPCV